MRGLPACCCTANTWRHTSALPFALYSSVASLSLVVVITDIGVHTHSITSQLAAALVGAAVLSVLIFPTLAGALLAKSTAAAGRGRTSES